LHARGPGGIMPALVCATGRGQAIFDELNGWRAARPFWADRSAAMFEKLNPYRKGYVGGGPGFLCLGLFCCSTCLLQALRYVREDRTAGLVLRGVFLALGRPGAGSRVMVRPVAIALRLWPRGFGMRPALT